MKVYNATYRIDDPLNPDEIIPVAAQSLQHAARKAAKEEDNHGELVKIELTKDVII